MKIIELGTFHGQNTSSRRQILLTNQISITFLAIAILIFIADLLFDPNGLIADDWKFLFFFLSGAISLVLNKLKKTTAAKLYLSFSLPLALLFYPLLITGMLDEYYFWYPYAIIGFSIIPHLIFDFKSNPKLYILSIVYMLVLLIIYSIISNIIINENAKITEIIEQNNTFIIIAYYMIFIFFNVTIIYLKRVNTQYEKELKVANEEIENQKNQLHEKNSNLESHKKELESKNNQLQNAREELYAQNEELTATLDELKETQAQLIQSEKMASLGILTAGIAHEINNPINYVRGGTEGLKSIIEDIIPLVHMIEDSKNEDCKASHQKIINYLKDNNFQELIEDLNVISSNIISGVDKTTEIIRALKTFSHPNCSDFSLCNINQNIDSVLVLLNHRIKHIVDLSKNYDNIPDVYCSYTQINQVFMNILDNALHALGEEGGKIEINTSYNENEEMVNIAIKNNGPHIPSDMQNKIFEPFYTTKEIGQGTGLGLFMCYKIISNHHGNIKLNSAPNKGVEFVISIPTGI